MSRIGKQSINLPSGVTVTFVRGQAAVKGPKGELLRTLHPDMDITTSEGVLRVAPRRTTKASSALWGLTRSLLANMVEGVINGFQKKLEFEGIGYRAALDPNGLQLQLGFSHPVKFPAPKGITFTVEKNVITVTGIDKELVGEVAARLRALKPPEPYKGKGIRYQGEIIRRKAGKKAIAASG